MTVYQGHRLGAQEVEEAVRDHIGSQPHPLLCKNSVTRSC